MLNLNDLFCGCLDLINIISVVLLLFVFDLMYVLFVRNSLCCHINF